MCLKGGDLLQTGSFVILKKDAAGEDPSKHPVIWRIDGKALLQKYEAFDEDDKVLHKNTSIVSMELLTNSMITEWSE